jgi:GTP-binding protein
LKPARALKVVIVGRPNVGKSTLFNRLAGRRLAIVDGTPGVTRDRQQADVELGAVTVTLTDTAGFEEATGDDLTARIQAQTRRAIAEADLALMLIDARAGVTPLDHALADILRRWTRPVLLAANKYDGGAGEAGWLEAFGLGLGEPVALSAVHGDGLGVLVRALNAASASLPERGAERAAEAAAGGGEDGGTPADAEPAIVLAVVGRPNVGKSTLINRLLGEERLITGPEAGITRDAIAVAWNYQGRAYRLIDTAGLRRQAKVDDRLERLAAADSIRAIRFTEVAVIVIDGTLGLEKQDLSIIGLVAEEGRAPVLALNKWDLVEDRRRRLAEVEHRIETSLAQVRGLPMVPVSALTGDGIGRLLAAVTAAHGVWNRHIGTSPLNRWLADATRRHPPPSIDGRPLKLRYITQVSTRPPRFTLFVNRAVAVPETYLRYLAGGLRETFQFDGVPLRFLIRHSRNPFASGDDGGTAVRRSRNRARRPAG